MGARDDLAAAFVTSLATAGVDATVYAEPADVVVVPAVVIDAAQEYIQPQTYGAGGPGAWLWNFVIHITVPRATVAPGFDSIEQIHASLVAACNSLGATMGLLSGPQTVPVNDVPTLQSDLEIAWLTERKT